MLAAIRDLLETPLHLLNKIYEIASYIANVAYDFWFVLCSIWQFILEVKDQACNVLSFLKSAVFLVASCLYWIWGCLVSAVSFVYHIVLSPYYAVNYLYSIAKNISKLVEDFSTELKLFTEASINKLTSLPGTVMHICLSVAQEFIQVACATSLNWNSVAMASTDQVYFYNNYVLFADSASLKDLVYSLCMLPILIVIVLIRDICSYHRYIMHAILNLLSADIDTANELPLHVPLPYGQVCSVYCVVEEVVWVLWLTMKDNYAESLMFCILCFGGLIVIKKQSLNYHVRHSIQLDREGAQLDQADGEPVLLDSSADSDSEEPIVIELSRTRSQRPMRSRSSTSELTMPGS